MGARVFQAPEQECKATATVSKADAQVGRGAVRSLAPLNISDTRDNWVSAGMPTVHGIMYLGIRSRAIMSHG